MQIRKSTYFQLSCSTTPRRLFLLAILYRHWWILWIRKSARTHLKLHTSCAVYSSRSPRLQGPSPRMHPSRKSEPDAYHAHCTQCALPKPQNHDYLQTFWYKEGKRNYRFQEELNRMSCYFPKSRNQLLISDEPCRSSMKRICTQFTSLKIVTEFSRKHKPHYEKPNKHRNQRKT